MTSSDPKPAGLLLALTTAISWGTVPLAMTPLVASVSAVTVSWFRFAAAGLFLLLFFQLRGGLRRLPRPNRFEWALLIAAVIALVGNYTLYVASLSYVGAPVVQSVIQVAPVLMMVLSLWVFNEQFITRQWVGFVVLLAGIIWFCYTRLIETGAAVDVFSKGVYLILAAAISWVFYGLAQKRLLHALKSQQVLMLIYLMGAALMFPFAALGPLPTLGALELGLLAFLGVNTLVAYGAFAEALNHWDAARVSAVLAFQPVVTLIGASFLGWAIPSLWPAVPLTLPALSSALVIVLGSMLCALGGKTR